MRTKFTVNFRTEYRYDCNSINEETHMPWWRKGEVCFHDKYYYLGNSVSDCLTAFWNHIYRHGYNCCPKEERVNIIIEEITREEVPEDYSCGHVDGAGGGTLVVTHITSDLVYSLWNPNLIKIHTILLEKPKDFTDVADCCLYHYGKGMENLKVGDLVDCTCEINSLMTGICTFYNLIGKNDLELAKRMYDKSLHWEKVDNKQYYSGWFDYVRRRGHKIIEYTPYGMIEGGK